MNMDMDMDMYMSMYMQVRVLENVDLQCTSPLFLSPIFYYALKKVFF